MKVAEGVHDEEAVGAQTTADGFERFARHEVRRRRFSQERVEHDDVVAVVGGLEKIAAIADMDSGPPRA